MENSNNNKGKDEENLVETVINAFVSITSASVDDALTFLSGHEFNLGPAIDAYYVHRQREAQAAAIRNQPSIIPNPSPSPVPAAAMSSREDKNKKKAVAGSSGRGGIRTLADLNRQSGPGSDIDSNGPQEHYTGGEKSGMLFQDPTKGGHNVDAIFDQARQMGAMQGSFDELHPSSSSRSFTGTGRLLSGETVPAAPRPPKNIVHNIYFWTNGFTIDDGPLRRFDDPANALFLERIKRSECPKELETEDRKSTVYVNLIRREENCLEPVRRLTPFQGVGRTLGGFAPNLCSESVAQEPAAAVTSAPAVAAPVVVDDSRPTTSLQLRLADGSRTVARFNTDHTVGDIRAFINNHAAINGRAAPATYTLQTVGFPPKQLTDATQTIEQAGLANSVVIQRL